MKGTSYEEAKPIPPASNSILVAERFLAYKTGIWKYFQARQTQYLLGGIPRKD
jgi:hypothetical protein